MGVARGLGHSRISPCIQKLSIAAQLMGLALVLGLMTGCQTTRTVSNAELIDHQLRLDFSGLKTVQTIEPLHVTCSMPERWHPLQLQETGLYNHQQWKSPTGYTGCGVVYVHMPLPLSAKALIWFAKLQYAKDSSGGRLVKEWTDELGRPWFEGENSKYHVRGYVEVDGFSAWLVYFGYKVNRPINTAELGIAARCIETVVPMTGERHPSHSSLAEVVGPNHSHVPS